MPTLKDIKKQRGLTNAEIGNALGRSPSVAGMILQGRYISVYHDRDIDKLAHVLGITFERCWMAMCESLNEFRGTPGVVHQRADEVREEALTELNARFPDLGIEVKSPREMATIESVLVVPEERRVR